MYVGVKNNSFNAKLEKLHSLEDKILIKYGIDKSNFFCPCCNHQIKFFTGRNNAGTGAERGYLKAKCYGCNKNLDIIDIVKIVDSQLKNLNPGAIVNFLLSQDYSKIKVASLEKTSKKAIKNVESYDEFIGTSLNNFNKKLEQEDQQSLQFLYSRGYSKDDLKYLKNYIGLTDKNNIVFPCSFYSFIVRLIKPWKTKKQDKFIRYINSKALQKTEHYCYLLDTVNAENLKKNYYNLYLFEGVFDCITLRILLKNNCLAIATGGADSNHDLIANKINKIAKELDKKVNLIILFDNDNAGTLNTNLIAEKFDNNYVKVFKNFSSALFKNSKDISEEFKNNRAELQRKVNLLNIYLASE